jgi:uncharacterized protein YdhG (YjbR/CyaY superfamily)
MKTKEVKDVDSYISSFPEETQLLLKTLRATILKVAPKAEEGIGYQMPSYKLGGVLLYFAGYKNHIGFYPSGSAILFFNKELTTYNYSKGAIQFPLTKKLPIGLISKIVKFRVKENIEKINSKKK